MASVRHLGVFPFCVPEGTSGGFWSIGLSLSDAMMWFWRVKEWSVSADYSTTEGSGSFEFVAQAEYLDPGTYEYVVPADERDLVCYELGQIRLPPPDGAPYTCQALLFNGGQFGQWAINDAGLIYPGIQASFSASTGTLAATLGNSATGAGELTVDGNLVYAAIGGDTVSASMTIIPETYWEYDPGDGGGPIYDSATGDKLRGFPL